MDSNDKSVQATETKKSVESPAPPAEKQPIEVWAKVHRTPDWLFAAVKYGSFHDAQGWECTEAEYVSACAATAKAPLGKPVK